MKNGRCRMHGGKSPGAPRGNQNALYSREQVEIEMTPDQVGRARRLAAECEARKFRDC